MKIYLFIICLVCSLFSFSQNIWINEIDYDNPGIDTLEFIEIGGESNLDLSSYRVVLINKECKCAYSELELFGELSANDTVATKAFYLPKNSLQNGDSDGLMLFKEDSLIQFLTYEGVLDSVMVSLNNPAGYKSTGIGQESNSVFSLQLTGSTRFSPFSWELLPPTPNAVNQNQEKALLSTEVEVWINEIDYDNPGVDEDEFVEIAGSAGADLSSYSLLFINGNCNCVYDQLDLFGSLPFNDSISAIAFNPPSSLQNGASDGILLVQYDTVLIHFVSYEGTIRDAFLSTDSIESVDVGEDSGSLNYSLQLIGQDKNNPEHWVYQNISPGGINEGQMSSLVTGTRNNLDFYHLYSLNKNELVLEEESLVTLYNLSGELVFEKEIAKFLKFNQSGLFILQVKSLETPHVKRQKVFFKGN